MKKLVATFSVLLLVLGLVSCGGNAEKELEQKIDLENMKTEIYLNAYEEGYMDAVDAVISEMPWYMIDAEELESSLYMIFDDGAFAEEVRDLIFSYCELYEHEDFEIAYSDSAMDFGY